MDFRLKITRKDFYENSTDLFELVTKPLDIALERAGKEKSDIDGIFLWVAVLVSQNYKKS